MEQNENLFEYTYSAPQQEEVKKIREKYLPRKESKMDLLRRLDERATRKALTWSLTLGIFSALIFGIGMSCTMLWGERLMIPGIIIGCIGIAGTVMAYPLNNLVTKQERERLAPEILRLTEELMGGQC